MPQKLRPYVVRQGDHLVKLAYVHGFDAQEVWNHEKNATLKAKRKTQDVLYPGDILYLPVKHTGGLPVSAGGDNNYCAKVPTIKVRLQLVDIDGPLAHEECEVSGTGSTPGDPLEVVTDADGWLDLTISTLIRRIEVLALHANHLFKVSVGDLNPIDEPPGAPQRLANLGLLSQDDVRQGRTAGAVVAFQKQNNLPADGSLTESTLSQLHNKHKLWSQP